ncbi:ribonuclease H [Senna tora]|uniref:Ribonuclease H n=1 Tax=Senna tora TaxID=362788 RepID=A0A834SZF1_9FABA|nr:ribonuclease H [Senna tora]
MIAPTTSTITPSLFSPSWTTGSRGEISATCEEYKHVEMKVKPVRVIPVTVIAGESVVGRAKVCSHHEVIRASKMAPLELDEILSQKARCQWIKDGDRNTRYYHTKAINRRRKNKIVMLKNQNAIGHKINPSKSNIYFSKNVKEDRKTDILALTDFRQSQEVGKYLGANLLHGRHSRLKYRHIVEKIQARLAGWKASCLSLAGRATLAQSVISAVPLYYMQHSSIPIGITKEIEKIERGFLWGSTNEKRKMHQLSWSTVCMPKDAGGFGIRSLTEMNKAFKLKLLWQILSNQNRLWVKIILNKYKIGSYPNPVLSSKNTDSKLWKEMCKLWPEFVENVHWEIGNGSKTSFWNDRKLEEMVPNHVLSRILETNPPNPLLGPDQVMWSPGNNDVFSISSAYKVLMKYDGSRADGMWKCLWKSKIQQRSKLILWRLGHDRLPTRSLIASWSGASSSCPWCDNNRETNIHGLRDCCKVAQIWKRFLNSRDRALFFNLPSKEWIHWNLKRNSLFCNIPWPLVFSVACELFWKWRNMKNKDHEFSFPYEAHCQILQIAKNHAQAFKPMVNTGTLRTEKSTNWSKPEKDWIKVNVDGAMCSLSGKTGCGGLARNNEGCWLKGFSGNLGKVSAFNAELWGIHHGLNLAWNMGWKRIIMESDSLVAVKKIRESQQCDANESPILDSIRRLLRREWVVKMNYIPRASNSCADKLAKHGLSFDVGICILDCPPLSLTEALRMDGVANILMDPG